jgi:hypothetical protein
MVLPPFGFTVLGFFRAALIEQERLGASQKALLHLVATEDAKGKDSPPHFGKNRMLTPELGVAHQSKHPPARWIFAGHQQIASNATNSFSERRPLS